MVTPLLRKSNSKSSNLKHHLASTCSGTRPFTGERYQSPDPNVGPTEMAPATDENFQHLPAASQPPVSKEILGSQAIVASFSITTSFVANDVPLPPSLDTYNEMS